MYSIKQLAEQIGATYIGEDKPFSGIHFDSRQIKPGDIFVAIVAERDGHDYIPSAIKNGAGVLLVNHQVNDDIPQIIVEDTEKGLGQLAKIWKSQFNIPVIALTGSCGKTTTKEMLANIFKQVGDVAYTQGNFNNSLGVPLTLFQLRKHHNYLIVEMGTNNPGEIPYLVSLVTPDVSLITNIGACHTEGLKSLDGIMQEKGNIFKSLSNQKGAAIINLDDPYIAEYAKQLKCKKIKYAKRNRYADVHLVGEPKLSLNTTEFDARILEETHSFKVNLFGLHQIDNALSAIAVATACGIDNADIAIGLERVTAYSGRNHVIPVNDQFSIIDDCYNAGYPSVISAIKSLDKSKSHKVLVLSNMGELGEDAEKYHRLVGKCIQNSKIDDIFLYGDPGLIHYIQDEIDENRHVHYHENKPNMIKEIQNLLSTIKTDKLMLVKGSHANNLGEVVQACLQTNNKDNLS